MLMCENDRREDPSSEATQGAMSTTTSYALTAAKLLAAAALFYSAGLTFAETYHHISARSLNSGVNDYTESLSDTTNPINNAYSFINWDGHGRRLASGTANVSKENPPSYMKDLLEDLKSRTKLMDETPPAEVKYWFEYTGPLQVSNCSLLPQPMSLYYHVMCLPR
jgi:hypothetical protein